MLTCSFYIKQNYITVSKIKKRVFIITAYYFVYFTSTFDLFFYGKLYLLENHAISQSGYDVISNREN